MLRKFHKKHIVLLTGFATFFFGFGAAAALNLYLFSIHSPLVLQFRSSLNFVSSILGDGIILPIVNMLAIEFILTNLVLFTRLNIIISLSIGLLITAFFHIAQSINDLVNWSMPTPWHWNFLGFWHMIYMFAVATLLSLYFLLLILVFKKEKKLVKESLWVILGLFIFFVLLKFDYT